MAPTLPPVRSTEVNDYIKKYAHKEDNLESLTLSIRKAFNIDIHRKAVQERCRRLNVTTRGIFSTGSKSFSRIDLKTTISEPAREALDFLKRRRTVHTIEDIANALVTSPRRVKELIQELRDSGHTVNIVEETVELSSTIPKSEPIQIDRKQLDGNKFKFLLTADNHISNKHERLDVLNALFDIADAEGITTCYQLGNVIDGDHHFNKHEVLCRGVDAQVKYLVDVWPKKKGITTHFITGDDHEGWYINREGIDVGFYIQQRFEESKRTDFQYLGHVEADILLPGKRHRNVMRLIHAGGGTAYATSYSTQKIVESYQGGEKPRILCVGHYHKANFDYSREVFTYQGGCTCDQTTFMRKKKLQAHVGGWIIELTINDDGDVVRCNGEWIPFYDKGVYKKAWKAKNY